MTTAETDQATVGAFRRLRDFTRAERDRGGSKAANLGELARAGFPVPDGFVLTTDAFERFTAANGLGPESSPEAISGSPLPSDLAEAIATAAAALGDGPLAVRSSAVAEDLADASFAGQYETILGVQAGEELLAAVRRCWASAFSARVAAYQAARGAHGAPQMAVLVQRLIAADAAGVAFTANPVTGDRDEVLVSAVKGLGERLVSGQATPDEWLVRDQNAICRGAVEGAIDVDHVREVAALARRVEAHFGAPQDIEWAIAGGELFLLQARPITALPEPVKWQAPLPGGWARNFRLGEWLGDPVTPLFESWLLTRLEDRLSANYQQIAGVPPRPPHHVVVNGWYFASMNFAPDTPLKMLLLMLRYWLPKMLVQPRRAAMMMPPLAGLGVELFLRDWRVELLPRYRAIVQAGEARVEDMEPNDLLTLVEQVARVAGDYFTSITFVAGFGWKAELPLATFYREHLAHLTGGSHQQLLSGLIEPTLQPHAVQGLDWVHPTLGELDFGAAANADPTATKRRARREAERRAAEAEARATLASQPKLQAKFEKLLARAQRFAQIREEQVSSFTLGWPLMRRALLRLGARLRQVDPVAADEDVFFLSRDELLSALRGDSQVAAFAQLAAERRRTWERERRLTPPLTLGELSPLVKKILEPIERAFAPVTTAEDGLRGLPTSPGRATGPVRIIRQIEEFHRLQAGDVLVATATTPAWTLLFARAAAVVTDVGSPIAHASLVAREYGIPAVVGTGDATARLSDGQIVTVDGNTGLVKLHT